MFASTLKFFGPDESEVGSVFLLESPEMERPFSFLTYVKVDGTIASVCHHTLSGLRDVFQKVHPGVELTPDFDTSTKFLFMMRGSKRVHMWHLADKDHQIDQLDGIMRNCRRNQIKFETEDAHGNIEKFTHTIHKHRR